MRRATDNRPTMSLVTKIATITCLCLAVFLGQIQMAKASTDPIRIVVLPFYNEQGNDTNEGGDATIHERICDSGRSASNFYWIISLMGAAKAKGIGTLLTGQMGNATISWTGIENLLSTTSWYAIISRLLTPLPMIPPSVSITASWREAVTIPAWPVWK